MDTRSRKTSPRDAEPGVLPPPKPSRSKVAFLCLLVALVTALAHHRVLTARATSMNDGMYVTQNRRVLNPSWENVTLFLSEIRQPATVKGYYQPLPMISLMLDTAIWGASIENVHRYHVTSWLLHAANAALMMLLMYQLFGRLWPAVVVGALFGVHPITVEAIAWLGERKTPLATFFALSCLVAYVHHARRGSRLGYALSLVAFALALMSKPTVTPLPAMMILLDLWPLHRLRLRSLIEKIPYLVLAGISAVITMLSQQHTQIVDRLDLGLGQRLLIACHNLLFYPLKLIWPAGLSTVYPFPEAIGFSDTSILLGVVFTALALLASIAIWRRSKGPAVCLAMFAVALAPTVVNVGYAVGIAADKYVYFPIIGLFIGLAGLLTWTWTRSSTGAPPRMIRGCIAGISAAIWLALAAGTHAYLGAWQNTGSYCRHILETAPEAAWVHGHLGHWLLEQGKADEAIDPSLRAVELDPDHPESRLQLAQVLGELGRMDQAETHLRHALSTAPEWSNLLRAQIHNELGRVLAAGQRFDEALSCFRAALPDLPDKATAHFNLALALEANDQVAEAAEHFEAARGMGLANPEALFDLAGRRMLDRGDTDGALQILQRGLGISEADAVLGVAFFRIRVHNDEEGTLTLLRQHSGLSTADAHCHLADMLLILERFDDAGRLYHRTLELQPNHPGARQGLNELASRSYGKSR